MPVQTKHVNDKNFCDKGLKDFKEVSHEPQLKRNEILMLDKKR